jgi:hypothetical protein
MKEFKENKNDESKTHKIYDINQIRKTFLIGTKTPSQKLNITRNKTNDTHTKDT